MFIKATTNLKSCFVLFLSVVNNSLSFIRCAITDIDWQGLMFDVVVEVGHVERVQRRRAEPVKDLGGDEARVVFTQARFVIAVAVSMRRPVDVTRRELRTLDK